MKMMQSVLLGMLFWVVLTVSDAVGETREMVGNRSELSEDVRGDMQRIRISSFDVREVDAKQAFQYLQALMGRNDLKISMFLRLPADNSASAITGLNLNDVSVSQVLDALCSRYDLWWKLDRGLTIGTRDKLE